MGKFRNLTEKLHNVTLEFDLQEDLNSIDYLTESQKKLWKVFGDTPLKIEGSAGLYKKGFINKNTRRYDKMKEWVEKKQEDVKEGKITGRIDHAKPGEANLTGTAFLYKELSFNEDTGIFSYSGHTLPNEYGKELKGYVVSGVYVGNSTCGKGKVENIEIDGKMIEDVVEFELEGIDFVKRPSNEYGRVETFENEGGEDMTLEELKAKYPELVESLEAEFGKKSLNEMKVGMEDFIIKYPELWEKLVKEMMVRLEGYKPYNGVYDSINEIKDTLKKLSENKISDTEEDKTEDVKTVTESIKVEETEEYKKIVEELNAYKEKEELAKVEKEKQEAIEEAVKDSEFSEQLKKTLAECKNAEEVKAKVVTTKTLIEEILSAQVKKEVSGRGLAEDKEDLDLGNDNLSENREPKFGEDGL